MKASKGAELAVERNQIVVGSGAYRFGEPFHLETGRKNSEGHKGYKKIKRD